MRHEILRHKQTGQISKFNEDQVGEPSVWLDIIFVVINCQAFPDNTIRCVIDSQSLQGGSITCPTDPSPLCRLLAGVIRHNLRCDPHPAPTSETPMPNRCVNIQQH